MKHTLLSAILLLALIFTPVIAVAQGGQLNNTTSGGSSGGGGATARSSSLIFPKDTPLTLLQPPDETIAGQNGTRTLAAKPGIQIIFDYFALAWPWLIGTAAGIAVLQGVVGGVQIMYAGSPEGVGAGKERFQWALFGLLMVGLAGIILRIINPIFYK